MVNDYWQRVLQGMLFMLLCIAWGGAVAWAGPKDIQTSMDFSLFKLGTTAPVVLVVGGIQGDEPGGFSAATLLATRYRVHAGTLWVVPNLNFPSIVQRSRGIHGDMNRKFARLDTTDPEYSTVSRIQGLIRASEVRLVLNLHDGSGFFRHQHEGPLFNPARWGQAVIIDQEHMDDRSVFLSHLSGLADRVTQYANAALLQDKHKYHVRNTRTAQGDREMEKSLSWYAVRHGKAAFGLEASKEFAIDMRVYYHLRLVEGFLREAGVHFERDFELSPHGVAAALQSDLSVTFANNRVVLPLEDIRPYVGYLPLPRNGPGPAIGSKPIMAVVPDSGYLNVQYGNRIMTRIRPDWREMDNGLDSMRVMVDNTEQHVFLGQVLTVREHFNVSPVEGYRVNAIGVDSGKADESGMLLTRKHFKERFSLDKSALLYRVEIYKNTAFVGMFLVQFGTKKQTAQRNCLPSVEGKPTPYGR
ncbi:MAG: M99 family carboxypeptidase catalytic domain-containing protein [Desulfovibrionaceae bacterium]